MSNGALLFRDGAGFDEQNRVATAHPVSALCVLAPSDSKNLGLIAAASRTDHIVRFYRLDETSPLYQLEGHTDTGITSLLCV